MRTLTAAQIANRRRWARALESSRQARSALADQYGRECCLGVACRVLAGKTLAHMRDHGMPGDVEVDLGALAGVSSSEEHALVRLNDDTSYASYEPFNVLLCDFSGSGMTHPEIALYLYLTAEAGIA